MRSPKMYFDFSKKRRGASLLEYAVIFGALVVVASITIPVVGNKVRDLYGVKTPEAFVASGLTCPDTVPPSAFFVSPSQTTPPLSAAAGTSIRNTALYPSPFSTLTVLPDNSYTQTGYMILTSMGNNGSNTNASTGLNQPGLWVGYLEWTMSGQLTGPVSSGPMGSLTSYSYRFYGIPQGQSRVSYTFDPTTRAPIQTNNSGQQPVLLARGSGSGTTSIGTLFFGPSTNPYENVFATFDFLPESEAFFKGTPFSKCLKPSLSVALQSSNTYNTTYAGPGGSTIMTKSGGSGTLSLGFTMLPQN